MYRLFNLEGRVGALYITVLILGMSWMVYLHFSIRYADAEIARAQAEAGVNRIFHREDVDSPPQSISQRIPIQSRTGDPTLPGYQTPFTAKKPFSTRPLQPSNFSGLANDAPVAYQTLQGNGMLNADGTPNKWLSPTGHFAKLAREAPASYATLQKSGMLGADGMPTRKWEAKKRMPDHQGFGGEGKEKAEEEGRKNGRAILMRELDDVDFS
jgi:hypothetical protein